MCGLTGYWQAQGFDAAEAAATAGTMADSLRHRGPDDAGVWVDSAAGLALAHRRLSIIDLSPAGHQPMASASGRYVMVLNGEIYNHPELREQFDGHSWRGHSDTEVLLAAIERWGVVDALKRAVGMFALVIWDRAQRTLHLARDRMGEKPLYYGWQQGIFLFGSELKALRRHPRFEHHINRDAVCMLLRHAYVPSPHSIYRGIHKLLPGSILTIPATTQPGQLPAPEPYWSLQAVVESGRAERFPERNAAEALEARLLEAVRLQMAADVPLGAFLSGGVDSSTVVALMQAQASRPVKTFTIGFQEQGFDEAPHAKAVAQHLRTDHTELYVTPSETLDVIPSLPSVYDEPFADSSQIPTFLISKLARQHVTVALTGDAGDELFGGYNRYFLMSRLWARLRLVPRPLRALLGRVLSHRSVHDWDRLLQLLLVLLPRNARFALPGEKVIKLAGLLSQATPMDIYRGLLSYWSDPDSVVLGAHEPSTSLTSSSLPAGRSIEEHMMFLDAQTYLPDDILVKVDRAAMAVGLETRVPMLDHRVVEFAWTLPLNMKVHRGEGKHLLREVAYKYVPKRLLARPKMGFGVPIEVWLRGPLREWGEALLDERRLQREGYFNPQIIRRKWQEHLSGRRDWQYQLWCVLMFQAWLAAERTI